MDVLMPQLGETVTEGTVVRWHKAAGDSVQKGELLLDLETDKVATEIESPASGILNSIVVDEGETVDVGTVLGVIAVPGEKAEKTSEPAAAPAASERGRVSMPEKSTGERLSPAVRRLVKEHGLDISAIRGTGHGGRVTRRDVLDHLASDSPAATASVPGADTRIPFNRIRRVTAEHMLRSKATSPHVLQTIEVDFATVERARLPRRDGWRDEHGFSLSYLPFVARALCLAIAEFPRVNASVEGDGLVVHEAINLAIAIDLDFDGLVAPVVRDAAELKVTELALRFHQLGMAAKGGKLTADELQGGTYTLSNPGPFGTLFTAPIINQPQVAILSMDAIRKRPVVIEGDAGDRIDIRPVGVLAQSFDHRAFDGAYSAAFLQRLRAVIEQQDWDREL